MLIFLINYPLFTVGVFLIVAGIVLILFLGVRSYLSTNKLASFLKRLPHWTTTPGKIVGANLREIDARYTGEFEDTVYMVDVAFSYEVPDENNAMRRLQGQQSKKFIWKRGAMRYLNQMKNTTEVAVHFQADDPNNADCDGSKKRALLANQIGFYVSIIGIVLGIVFVT